MAAADFITTTMLNPLRYSFRQLAKTPGFSFAAILTIALGIGAHTAVFSIMNAAAARTLRSMLFGLSSTDPTAWIAALGGIAVVTLAAALLPARRAPSIDPMRALRSE